MWAARTEAAALAASAAEARGAEAPHPAAALEENGNKRTSCACEYIKK